MRIRDALESDAEALAAATGRPRGVVTDMIHDRSVRVAIPDANGDARLDADAAGDAAVNGGEGGEAPSVRGFVAFDARGQTVHVTDFEGDRPTVSRLLEEPLRFASREGMDVEIVVPEDDERARAVEAAGFEPTGNGPQFEGRETTRYRLDPAG
ncbi:hypothetical protein GJ633_13665 [Halorubrum sp. CBA1125]|uniref:hypothetical protein n=1 Tax=Halorubrum sp. CBA1125 TaxID=2668072 RepID=UPI0012E94383|nr:hypothetical protein [Halorubrum sp. CBA1125]MUW15556.1 hypothetical protein [Halorubrum sp. CBA1125]